jgi:hypothetical protein
VLRGGPVSNYIEVTRKVIATTSKKPKSKKAQQRQEILDAPVVLFMPRAGALIVQTKDMFCGNVVDKVELGYTDMTVVLYGIVARDVIDALDGGVPGIEVLAWELHTAGIDGMDGMDGIDGMGDYA